jgi:hypothetical protein
LATAQVPTRATVPQFAAWAIAGTCLAGVLLFAFTLFSYVALVVGVALVLLALRLRGANRSALGLLVGVAAASFYVGWLNRGGPGYSCTSDALGQSCVQEESPWPWLGAGLVLVAVAVAGSLSGLSQFAQQRLRHRQGH